MLIGDDLGDGDSVFGTPEATRLDTRSLDETVDAFDEPGADPTAPLGEDSPPMPPECDGHVHERRNLPGMGQSAPFGKEGRACAAAGPSKEVLEQALHLRALNKLEV